MKNESQASANYELGMTERNRVTRELHDIEQSLAILGVQMMRAGKAVSGMPGTLHPGVSDLAEKLKEIGARVGRLSGELRSFQLKSFDLAEAVSNQCRQAAQKSGIPVDCRCEGLPADLDNLLSLSMLRVVQEALDNAGRHSRAKRIQVEIVGSATEIRLMVSDDGIGFDAEEAMMAAGLGLISMRERVQLSGGAFKVLSKSGDGTRISARIPLVQESSATTA
jgi:signal transduction histidine kinase